MNTEEYVSEKSITDSAHWSLYLTTILTQPQNTESPILSKQGHLIFVMANISAKLLQDVTKEVLSNFAMCSVISPAISAHKRLM